MSNIDLSTNITTLDVGRKLDAYTGVVIHAGKDDEGNDLVFSAGTTSGYVLEIDNPLATPEMAGAILASLKLRSSRYQPYEANGSLLDPAAEIGDNVTVNGTASIIANRHTDYTPMTPSDISAPFDEEVNHEFQYESPLERQFKRESKYTRSRIKQNSNSIQLEVLRATEAEADLGSRIDMRVDSITLSVTSRNGSSTFELKDGSTTISSKTVDITCDALNISGQLTASQIAAGAITIGKLDADAQSKMVVESQARTQYYLSTSTSSATGGSWSNTIPTWTSGKYIWTRERTYNKYADGSSVYKYSPDENGRYDKNLTEARSTADEANTDAKSAENKSQIIFKSTTGGTLPTAPSAWVTDDTGAQNTWTTVRPEYDSTYKVQYTATQKQTVGGTVTCTTPKTDITTTKIDGAAIITGSIDADRIAVQDLSAFNATIGGWSIQSTRLEKEIDSQLARVRIQAPANPTASSLAISVGTRATTTDNYKPAFSVTYGGKVTCTDITVTGGDIGGADVTTTSFGGISIPTIGTNKGKLILPAANIEDGAIGGNKIADRGISAGKFYPKCISDGDMGDGSVIARTLGSKSVSTSKVTDSVNTALGYASDYNSATVNGTSAYPTYFTAGTIIAKSGISSSGNITASSYGVYCASLKVGSYFAEWKSANVKKSDGTNLTINYLGR